MKPRKNRSKHALTDKGYDYLYRYPDRPGIYYRRWSGEKQKWFVYATGSDSQAEAYSKGTDAFDEWLGAHLPKGTLLIRDLGRALLASKESRKGGKKGRTYRNVRNHIVNHIIPAFGHLEPRQITPLRWELYDSQERSRVYEKRHKDGTVRHYTRTSLSNTRKYLIEILHDAVDEGALDRVPKLKNFDPDAAPPRYIPKPVILRMIRAAGHARRYGRRGFVLKLLIFWMWKMGARPGEILQYQWTMIIWDAPGGLELEIPGRLTKNGKNRTIPINSRVAKLLARIRRFGERYSPWLFPHDRDPSQPVRDYFQAWSSVCERTGTDFDLYNLRDTFVTDALRRGQSSVFIGRYIDNSPVQIDKRYAVVLQQSLREVAG